MLSCGFYSGCNTINCDSHGEAVSYCDVLATLLTYNTDNERSD